MRPCCGLTCWPRSRNSSKCYHPHQNQGEYCGKQTPRDDQISQTYSLLAEPEHPYLSASSRGLFCTITIQLKQCLCISQRSTFSNGNTTLKHQVPAFRTTERQSRRSPTCFYTPNKPHGVFQTYWETLAQPHTFRKQHSQDLHTGPSDTERILSTRLPLTSREVTVAFSPSSHSQMADQDAAPIPPPKTPMSITCSTGQTATGLHRIWVTIIQGTQYMKTRQN